jgi:hypothetical protein
MRTNFAKLATTGAIAALMIVPSFALADGYRARQDRNGWNNLAIGAGAVGVIGLLSHNSTLATVGLVGAGYSVYRADTVGRYCRDWDRHDFRYDGRHDHDRRR